MIWTQLRMEKELQVKHLEIQAIEVLGKVVLLQ